MASLIGQVFAYSIAADIINKNDKKVRKSKKKKKKNKTKKKNKK